MKRGALLKIFGYTAVLLPLLLCAAGAIWYCIRPDNWAILILSYIVIACATPPCGMIGLVLGIFALLRSEKKVLSIILIVLGGVEVLFGLFMFSPVLR